MIWMFSNEDQMQIWFIVSVFLKLLRENINEDLLTEEYCIYSDIVISLIIKESLKKSYL